MSILRRFTNRGKCVKTQERWMNAVWLRASTAWSFEEVFSSPPANDAQRQEYIGIRNELHKQNKIARQLQRYLKEYMK